MENRQLRLKAKH